MSQNSNSRSHFGGSKINYVFNVILRVHPCPMDKFQATWVMYEVRGNDVLTLDKVDKCIVTFQRVDGLYVITNSQKIIELNYVNSIS